MRFLFNSKTSLQILICRTNYEEIKAVDIIDCYLEYEKNIPHDMIYNNHEKYVSLWKYSLFRFEGVTLMVKNFHSNNMDSIKYRLFLVVELMNLMVNNQLINIGTI